MGAQLASQYVAMLTNPESIKRSVRNGIGITIISKLVVREEIEDETILQYPFFQKNDGRELNIVYQRQHILSKAEESLIKIIQKIYGVS